MIEKLTEWQTEQLAVYRDKWISIGRCTKPLNKEAALAAMRQVYADGGLVPPEEIVFQPSPMAAVAYLKNRFPSLHSGDINTSIIYGQTDAGWLSFYDYFDEVCDVDGAKKCLGLRNLAKEAGWCFVFDTIAVICEKPSVLHINENNQLHCTNGPSLAYSNGDAIYSLNGVTMPDWLFTTPKDQLDPQKVLGIKNVEQRGEALKWFGLNKLLSLLNVSTIEVGNEHGYELIEVDIGTNRRERYLKMVNPSTAEIHVEGVPQDTETIAQADLFRQGNIVSKYGYIKPGARA